MARFEASTLLFFTSYSLYYLHCCCGEYELQLQLVEGNWTWKEAFSRCRGSNARLVYQDEITATVNMSEPEIKEDDLLVWLNDDQLSADITYPSGCLETGGEDGEVESVRSPEECAIFCKDFPLFAVKDSKCLCKANTTVPLNHTKCAEPDRYQLYKHMEPSAGCLLMYGPADQFIFHTSFVNCSMKARYMCRTDVVKAMRGSEFTWTEAQTLCLNASSKLVSLNMVSDTERKRSIDVVNHCHYWTNGVVKHGQAGQFEIVDCIEASGLSDFQISYELEQNSVYNCNQKCKDSGRIALMGEQCICLMPAENTTDWRTSGCTKRCFGNTRDRCGGNNTFSVYIRTLNDGSDQNDMCLAVRKVTNNTITIYWDLCRQPFYGCICRNATSDASYVISRNNITWAEAQVECESQDMILATVEKTPLTDDQIRELPQGAQLWTGVYSPTIIDFNSDEILDDDKCLSISNFKKSDPNIEEIDCHQHRGVICHNVKGVFHDITTLPDDHVMSDATSPDVTTTRMTPSFITSTSSPYTGMSPMIKGLISTVVFVASVLLVILCVLGVLLYRFKEQKRQLNMLKGPTISYSNLEHSVVVSYNGAPSNEDSGEDLGNLDNITEKMDALFMRKDELSPDEKSEHLYDISDNVDNKPPVENGVLNARERTPPVPDDRVYTEVELCEETGNPTIVSNRNSGSCRTSISSGDNKKLEFSKNEQERPLLDVSEKPNEINDKDDASTKNENSNDDEYDHTDTFVRPCGRETDTDTYDELQNKSFKRPRSNTEGLYDRANSDNYDNLKKGTEAKEKNDYEDVDLNFGPPS